MKRARAETKLEEVNAVLGALRGSNLLDGIGWSRAVETSFFARRGRRLPEPAYAIDRDALNDEVRALRLALRRLGGDHLVLRFLRSAVQSAIDRNELLGAVGTTRFGDLSREIYGGAKTTFFGLRASNVDLADHLLARLRAHGSDEARDEDPVRLDARALRAEFKRRIAKHEPRIAIEVKLDPHLPSKAIAGMTRVRIRPDATFAPWEADGLFCHEVETHAFTAQNGAAQRHAPFLRAGGPRTTPTQEGLAVFAELYHRALPTARLERLAVRVKMVEMAEEGASFLDVYRWLVDRGVAKRDAYLDASRIYRGGLVAGGAPFTKDACYLAGLLHVYAFLSVFVRNGFRDEAEMLVAGRIALDDVGALVALRKLGLLSRPVHRPRWLERWNTLLPYFAFASFMDAIDLVPVEAHYRELIELARD